jgi:hypothetical protein
LIRRLTRLATAFTPSSIFVLTPVLARFVARAEPSPAVDCGDTQPINQTGDVGAEAVPVQTNGLGAHRERIRSDAVAVTPIVVNALVGLVRRLQLVIQRLQARGGG